MLKRLLDSPWLYYGLAALLVVGALISQLEIQFPARDVAPIEDVRELAERDRPLNVVFILIDTLRADHLGMYGYDRDTSPTMDRLAETGIRFDRNVAQASWTKTSMASLWTSTYPQTNAILRYDQALPDEATFPAEIFRDAGYRTGGIYRNGWLGPEFGFSQGFDLYIKPSPVLTDARINRARISPHSVGGTDFDLTQSAIEFVRANKHEPFFLYLHMMDIHQYVYEQSSALFGTTYKDSYDNAIHWTDRNIGILVEELEKQGVMKDTLVVIASDHGEAFYEHGMEGHGVNLYREVIETPLVFILPFFVDPGVVVEDLTENVDIWPTILDIVGLPAMKGAQGHSLVAQMLGEAEPAPAPTVSHMERLWATDEGYDPVIAVTEGDERLFYFDARTKNAELYDHGPDPSEQINIANDRPERVRELIDSAQRYQQESPSAPWDAAPRSVEIDDMKLGVLKALGYVIGPDEEPTGRGGPQRLATDKKKAEEGS